MATINLLDKSVYNRISAGEVVERPQSVVKELFENSVDAGATEIVIKIENGGLSSITVQDNGCGIEKSEVEKAFMPHATSKLKTAKELESISTLGFRGEALASIASVSIIKMVTKSAADSLATEINIEGGEVVETKPSTAETGTTLTVTSLFYNTPARLKFLKTPRSEETEITTLVEKLILANPDISVKYYANDKAIFESFGDGFKNALLAVQGKNVLDNSIEICTEKNGILIEGFLGKINFTKSNRSYQTIIVNNRAVVDSTISMAIQNAYGAYLMKRQYPFYVIKLTVPPEIVDVNVHPRKSEIKFQNNQIIYGSIYSTVSKVLDGSSQAVEIIKSTSSASLFKENSINNDEANSFSTINENKVEKQSLNLDRFKEFFDKTNSETPKKTENTVDYSRPYTKVSSKQNFAELPLCDTLVDIKVDWSDKTKNSELDEAFAENKRYLEKLEDNAKQQSLEIDDELIFVGQVLNCFLIFECGSSLYIIDQHAAHERILYDNLLEKVKNKQIVRQQLLIPYRFTLNRREFDMVYDLIDYIRDLGIDIEVFGEDSFRVFTVPVEFDNLDCEKFFLELVNDASFRDEKIPTVIKEKLMQMACKSAIKSGDTLSQLEIDTLMAMLKGNMGLKCPHGRPIAVKITRTEIDKWFKRIV